MQVPLKDFAIKVLQSEPTFDVWLDTNEQCLSLTKNMQSVLFIAFRHIYIVFYQDCRSYLPFSKHNFSKQTTVDVLFGDRLVF